MAGHKKRSVWWYIHIAGGISGVCLLFSISMGARGLLPLEIAIPLGACCFVVGGWNVRKYW